MSKQYLYRVDILKKQNTHPLESIAYHCGESQFDSLNSKHYISSTEDKAVWNNIMLPAVGSEKHNHLPEYLKFRTKKHDLVSNARNILWQNIAIREKRADAQFARLFTLSIPSFMSQEKSIELIQDFSSMLIEQGMIADSSLHTYNKLQSTSIFEKLRLINSVEEKSEEVQQHHTAYIMCTLRDYHNGQFVNKNRQWNNLESMHEWRTEWLNKLEFYIQDCEQSEEKNVWINRLKKLNSKNISLKL